MKDSPFAFQPLRITIIPNLLAVSDGQQNFRETLASSATDVVRLTSAALKFRQKPVARHQKRSRVLHRYLLIFLFNVEKKTTTHQRAI